MTASSGFSVEVEGAQQFTRRLDEYAKRMSRPFSSTGKLRASAGRTNAALKIRADYQQELRTQIKHGQAGGWARLKGPNAARKAQTHPGKPLLVRTGRMMKQVTDVTARLFVYNISSSGRRLELGTRDEIAGYHQRGTSRMRARPLFVMTRKITLRWALIISESAAQGWKRDRNR